jgi:glutamate mutase epsilon subunit
MEKVAIFLLNSNIENEFKKEVKYSEYMFDKVELLKKFLSTNDKNKIIEQYEEKFHEDEDIIAALKKFPKMGALQTINRVTVDLESRFNKSLEKLRKYSEIMPYYLVKNKINMKPQYYSQLVKNKLL